MTDRGKEATRMSTRLFTLYVLLATVAVSLLAAAAPLVAFAANGGPGGP
jgi:hypothetical protein